MEIMWRIRLDLLLPLVGKKRNDADENINHIKLESYTEKEWLINLLAVCLLAILSVVCLRFRDTVGGDHTLFGQACVFQYFLSIVKYEATEYSQATV